MMGQDIYARFVDAASRLRDGETISYVMDGQTYGALAPPGDCFKNVVFKQVSRHFALLYETIFPKSAAASYSANELSFPTATGTV